MNKEQVQKQIEKAKKMAEKEVKQVAKDFDEMKKKVINYINAEPRKAALISAGVGAALGVMMAFLFRRRKR